MSIPVCRPLLAGADAILPYLREIDTARYYSNMGPLVKRFEQRLAEHFAVAPERLVTSSNGTLALSQWLRIKALPDKPLCVMPSWTFVATPAAAHWAGLTPFFVDIDQSSWALTPEVVRPLLAHQPIGAVVVVAPFGSMVDCAGWEAFQKESGIPVLIDAAAGFDSFSLANPQWAGTTLPFMVSLHATKVFGIGEGAVLVADDARVAQDVRMQGNFGFFGSRESQLAGTNAKLSEYAAAVGHAAFESWPQRRLEWLQLAKRFYREVVRRPKLGLPPGMNQPWASCYGQVIIPAQANLGQVMQVLQSKGVATVRWWDAGCHRQPAYANCPRADLRVTEQLAARTLGLPFWIGMEDSAISEVFAALDEALSLNSQEATVA